MLFSTREVYDDVYGEEVLAVEEADAAFLEESVATILSFLEGNAVDPDDLVSAAALFPAVASVPGVFCSVELCEVLVARALSPGDDLGESGALVQFMSTLLASRDPAFVSVLDLCGFFCDFEKVAGTLSEDKLGDYLSLLGQAFEIPFGHNLEQAQSIFQTAEIHLASANRSLVNGAAECMAGFAQLVCSDEEMRVHLIDLTVELLSAEDRAIDFKFLVKTARVLFNCVKDFGSLAVACPFNEELSRMLVSGDEDCKNEILRYLSKSALIVTGTCTMFCPNGLVSLMHHRCAFPQEFPRALAVLMHNKSSAEILIFANATEEIIKSIQRVPFRQREFLVVALGGSFVFAPLRRIVHILTTDELCMSFARAMQSAFVLGKKKAILSACFVVMKAKEVLEQEHADTEELENVFIDFHPSKTMELLGNEGHESVRAVYAFYEEVLGKCTNDDFDQSWT